jgi:class 3 adenylate cyclase/tetratricopeptide (TPR) repeat protein
MRCSKCGSDNREGRKFCANCGAALSVTCPKCGASNQPGEKFCGECGTAIGASSPRDPSNTQTTSVHLAAAIPATDLIDGERKMVTALFADIKGSMELMEDLDPEEARAIVDPALQLMIDTIDRYGGYVVQSTGDGIFALFGAPVAYEDHPQRALYAALRLQDGIRSYSGKLVADGGTPLEARVGVNTGEVVVRTLTSAAGRAEYTPIGHTANLAARMQVIAPSGSIAITEQTRRLVEGYFQLKARGPTRVKGLSEPVEVYEVTGLGPLRTRLQRAAVRGLTKFVGREREIEALKHAAALVRAGRGQVVAAMAEPGVGKSRLFHEFKLISQSGWLTLEAFSVSHGKATAYLPVIDLLHEYFAIEPVDNTRTRREKVGGKVLMLDRSLEDTLPYLLALLGLSEGDDSLAQMDPQIRRRRTGETIKRILLRESINQPLMVIFEDLHWIDPETQALLNLLVDAINNARMLLLVNYRPEYRHEWGSRTHYTQLRLDPLARESAEELLDALLSVTPPSPAAELASSSEGARASEETDLGALKHLIIERTEGTPFFIEEMVHVLFEEGVLQRNGKVKLVRPMSAVTVPITVQAVLASRIDRLSAPEKELLQTLAVLGREFSLRLAQHVTLKSVDDVEQILSRLQFGEFIYEQPAVGEVEYSFKHALTQEVAYNSILAERRRALHERIGHAIEELYTQQLEDHYSDLARHYLRGKDAAKAVHYGQLAAEQAVSRAAYTEASGFVQAALKLLEQLPNEAERLAAELGLRNMESGIAFALYGGGSYERERAISRMCVVGEMIGQKEHLAGLLTLSNLYFQRGEPLQGLELAGRCVSLAEATQDLSFLVDAYLTAGLLASSSGKLREAISYDEKSLRIYQANRASPVFATRLSSSVAVGGAFLFESAISIASTTPLQLLGRVSEAARIVEQTLRQAREFKRLHDLAFLLTVMSELFHRFRREPEIALARAEEGVAISEENGFTYWLHRGRVSHGCALTEVGEIDQGIGEIESGLAAFRRIGGASYQQYATALLAHAHARAGRTEQGLLLLNGALEHAQRTGARMCEAEMLRLKGQVLLMHDAGAIKQAETCFRAALEVARAQEAKWWELRSSVSLARLLRDTNRRDEARTMLGDIYNWFTEGFDLPDLKDAKALLDQLS